MASHKGSARAKRQAAFKAQLGEARHGDRDPFAAERCRKKQDAQKREAALRHKSCERKNRYASRLEAEAAIFSCEEHGTRGLHCYPCSYCNGWHLTSKPDRND